MHLYELLDLKVWDGLTSDQREAVAREVERRLPSSFQYAGLQTHTMGDQTHEIAFFDYARRRFALILGGVATLGYDRAHPFIPTEEMLEEWKYANIYEWNEETGYEELIKEESKESPTLEEYLDYAMTPLRMVTLKPFLVETVSTIAGLFDLSPDEVPSNLLRLVKYKQPPYSYEFPHEDEWLRISANVDGEMSVQRITEPDHAETASLLTKEGFRLPTSDEWEYACAAGSRTLWRWGNVCKFNGYPYRFNPADPRCLPNAFGLIIANDIYKWEACATPGLMRGGDGGTSVCGGETVLQAQLSLASAFTTKWHSDENISGRVRQVLDLPEE